ncbi:hypothetical protein [Halobacillus hunanensis]|uniref:hypothetical protein n=1 Tax=Halobacillus hunanensis TaxID=578214 RepID=UPI0009A827A4|nr:hypothetical protein [Halobacillus hunanensis]
MNKTGIFVLGLIGSILGMIGSIMWFFFGTYFFAGIVDADQPYYAPLTDGALGIGLIVSITQGVLTIAIFIITLVKSTPGSLDGGVKNSGVWLLVLGIIGAIINLFHLIPCVLIIIAGSIALINASKEKEQVVEQREGNSYDGS